MSGTLNWLFAAGLREEAYLAPGATGEGQSRAWDPCPSASEPQASLLCWKLPLGKSWSRSFILEAER